MVQHHLAGFARFQTLHLRPIANKSHDRASGCGVFIATEIDAAFQFHGVTQVYAELARRTGAVALRFHGGREAGFVDGEAAFTCHVRSEVHGETVGVVQLEYGFAGDSSAFQRRNGAFEQGHAVDQCFGEALFFLAQHPGHVVASRAQFRVGLAHDSVEICHQVREERLRLAQLVAVTNGATNDATQDVAAAFIGGQYAIGDEEAAGADVVCDNAQARAGGIGAARHALRRLQQRLEQVDVVVAVHALHDGADALEAHAGVDSRLRQRREHAVR